MTTAHELKFSEGVLFNSLELGLLTPVMWLEGRWLIGVALFVCMLKIKSPLAFQSTTQATFPIPPVVCMFWYQRWNLSHLHLIASNVPCVLPM